MAYRGAPSAGCIPCRQSKKGCGLEQPACSRCVRLNKFCSGYRDTSVFRIQDESEAVALKAKRRQRKRSSPKPIEACNGGILTPGSSHSSRSGDTPVLHTNTLDFNLDLDFDLDLDMPDLGDENFDVPPIELNVTGEGSLNYLRQCAGDLAMNYFFHQFNSSSHWGFLKAYAKGADTDPCLDLAMRACGMAALANVEHIPMGKEYARSTYGQALTLINSILRDPKKFRSDEALITVAILGLFENLTCDSKESIQSWKAHINGTAQLLILRGKAQFKTPMGRRLFRETRSQILIRSLWDDTQPPAVLWEWEAELSAATTIAESRDVVLHADKLTKICCDYAAFRHALQYGKIPNPQAAAEKASRIDTTLVDWSKEALAVDPAWRFCEMDVPDSPHVWNGMVHDYNSQFGPTIWNAWRVTRITNTRTQELLYRKIAAPGDQLQEQIRLLRRTRRQLTDEICATVPCSLGFATPARNSACVLMTAYSSIWPLFIAGTCALERLGVRSWKEAVAGTRQSSAATAQMAWILDRMDHISAKVGLRWAKAIAATLKGDFSLHDDPLPEQNLLYKFV